MTDQPTLTISEPPERAGRVSVRDLSEGPVAGAFGVRERAIRQKRNGEAFLQLSLSDGTGAVRAVSWDEVEERHGISVPGSVVWIRGEYRIDHRYGPTVTIRELRLAEAAEYDVDDLV